MAINQAYLFLIFTFNGFFIGLLFDFFRILRKSFKTINLITNIEDILFWVLTGISIIFCMYRFSDGSIRLYMFLGLMLGIGMYMLILSNIIIKLSVKFIIILKNIIKFLFLPFVFIINLLKNHIGKPIYFCTIKIKDFTTKRFKKILYSLKKSKNVQKT